MFRLGTRPLRRSHVELSLGFDVLAVHIDQDSEGVIPSHVQEDQELAAHLEAKGNVCVLSKAHRNILLRNEENFVLGIGDANLDRDGGSWCSKSRDVVLFKECDEREGPVRREDAIVK